MTTLVANYNVPIPVGNLTQVGVADVSAYSQIRVVVLSTWHPVPVPPPGTPSPTVTFYLSLNQAGVKIGAGWQLVIPEGVNFNTEVYALPGTSLTVEALVPSVQIGNTTYTGSNDISVYIYGA
jgi:hypothetical protein